MYDKGKKIETSRFASAAGLLFIALLVILLGGCHRRDAIMLLQEDGTSVTAAGDVGQELQDSDNTAIGTSIDSAGERDCYVTDSAKKEKNNSCIYVDVEGAVCKPGVYALPEGARVYEALAAAGGPLPEGDVSVLNQAALLQDEDQILIPGVAGNSTEGNEKSTTSSAMEDSGKNSREDADTESKGQQSENYGLIRKSQSDQVMSVQTASGKEAAEADAQTEGKINLNTATAQELQTLSGIGESKASAIIAYRESHGSFGTPEEIMQITGIKEGLYNRIKDKICAK